MSYPFKLTEMKKMTLVLGLAAGLASCTKTSEEKPVVKNDGYVCSTCATTPEAKAEHDGSSAGVYKGVVVGSSGTLAIYVHNVGTEVKAILNFDGAQATLTSESFSTWKPGEPIKNAKFTGTINGKKADVVFSVDSIGNQPAIEVIIPGHNVLGTIFKETSNTLVKSYEGIYTGDRTGPFNMTLYGNKVAIITNSKTFIIMDSMRSNTIDVIEEGMEVKGTVDADVVKGDWRDNYNNFQGTWTGKRTL